jgi:trehalose 6-phosphate phosphatase
MDASCRKILSELAEDNRQIVAIISSRTLEDLMKRVDIENIALAGSSGLEWLIPGNRRFGPDSHAASRLEKERKYLVPALRQLERLPGIEMEDKQWSTAIHFRKADPADRAEVARKLGVLQLKHGVTIHFGPDVAEVQFLSEVSKELAIKTLTRLIKPVRKGGRIIYAGDDHNDAQAMHWVLGQKGAVYVVGGRINIFGSSSVESPAGLAQAIRRDYPDEFKSKH